MSEQQVFDRIVDDLVNDGIGVYDNVVPGSVVDQLFNRVKSLTDADYQRAGIGRNQNLHIDDDYRTDEIHWLQPEQSQESPYLEWMEQLRLEINRHLYMGLFDYEAHFAHYAPGTYYKRHLDAFKGNTNRVVTTVFYLNKEWQESYDGEILMYEDESSEQPFKKVIPHYGRLVVFLSDRFPHEVIPAMKDRYSIAGWFRVKSVGVMADPPR